MEGQDVLRPRLEEALLAYYQSIVAEFRTMFFPEFLDRVPLLTTYSELARLLEPEAVIVHDDIWPQGEIGLLFSCTWDPDHGVGVRVRDGEIIEVDTQDICL